MVREPIEQLHYLGGYACKDRDWWDPRDYGVNVSVVHPARARRRRRIPPQFRSPAVRNLIAETGIDTATIPGTGAGGRVTRDDVLALAAGPPADEVVALNRIQLQTGANLLRSLQVAPHAFIAMEVDFERVDRARRAKKLTFLPFVARAVIDAIAAFPHVNASVGDGELIVHRDVHLGIAVDLDHEGLIVPVVRAAHGKRLVALAGEIADTATRARAKRLSPDDVVGGTFTITNPGPSGTMISAPIIHHPQVAILSTDGVKRRAVVVELDGGGEAIVVHAVGILGLSFDHRAFDGAYASAFLAQVRDIIETRPWDAEL
jgi:2-oxoglutarate dehydrogenase E2 component (dihydrolipoamide succinyltransferase)